MNCVLLRICLLYTSYMQPEGCNWPVTLCPTTQCYCVITLFNEVINKKYYSVTLFTREFGQLRVYVSKKCALQYGRFRFSIITCTLSQFQRKTYSFWVPNFLPVAVPYTHTTNAARAARSYTHTHTHTHKQFNLIFIIQPAIQTTGIKISTFSIWHILTHSVCTLTFTILYCCSIHVYQ